MPKPIIAVIDFQRVARESAAGKNVRIQVDKQHAAFQIEIKAMQAGLEKARKDLTDQQTVLAPEALNQKRKEYQTRAEEMQRTVQVRKRQLDQIFVDGMRQIELALVEVLKELANERKINMIINAARGQGVVLFADNDIVITEEARSRLDKRLPSLTLIPPEKKK
ncbi:MAG: OmpH family outer membrane protein [Alphaproteobacteria bacterium]|nr:OmpH family outer membrane protein [Alphaproteobacteria bacterium]